MQFIPSLHFDNHKDKLTDEWCAKVKSQYWDNSSSKSLLDGKDIEEIKGYATGDFPMAPFKRMYKSMKKALRAAQDINNENHVSTNIDTVGIDWTPLPLIPTKLNSAINNIHKIPVEIECKALDPLAAKKKQDDITFLKNKPILEADMQDIADQLRIGKVDLGGTKNSAIEYTDSPYGLDLNDSEDYDVFVNIFYSLKVEASFETILAVFALVKKDSQIRLLEIIDQFWWGVSVHQNFESGMTGLPDTNYVFPDDVRVPDSALPDYSDNPYRFLTKKDVSVMEFFNLFADEIGTEDNLNRIINGNSPNDKSSYCRCNDRTTPVHRNDFNTFKVELVNMEVKSIDWVGVAGDEKGVYLTTDTKDNVKSKIWGQNTYTFWWLKNTPYYFRKRKLGFATRKKGQESFQSFSTNIYRSQKISCVEVSIGENKKAQSADIKLQHTIEKSLPKGKYIDLRHVRNVLTGLEEEENEWTIQDLINMAFEQNIIIGDTEGFDGKNDGQIKPFYDIAGGLSREEVAGYMEVIINCDRNISRFTGINETLTGTNSNSDALIGIEKIRLNAALNSLDYCREAIAHQEAAKFNHWAYIIKEAIKKGGKPKQTIINLIGSQKVSILEGLEELPLHDLGIKISIRQREEERAKLDMHIARLREAGALSIADIALLENIENPRDRIQILAVKEKLWRKRQDKLQEQQFQQQQALMQQQGQNMLEAKSVDADSKIKEVYAKADAQVKVDTAAAELGIRADEFDLLKRRVLQQDRQSAQLNKSIETLREKKRQEDQASLPMA